MAISSMYCKSGLWLPSSLSLTTEDITNICDKIRKFYNGQN